MASQAKAKPRQIALSGLGLAPPVEGESREQVVSGNTLNVSGKSRRPITSLEELVEFFQIDTAIWEVKQFRAGSWEGQSLNSEQEVVVTPLYNISAQFVRKVQALAARCEIAATLAEAKRVMAKAPWKTAAPKRRKEPGSLMVMGIMDPHFGKLCWGRETGWEDYDVEIARACMSEAVSDLLQQASAMPYQIEQILLPLGNDFYHVDNGRNQTTGGTQMDVDGRRQRSYRAGREAVMEMVRALVQVAPVKVSIVPGNHDEETMFALGDALELVFDSAKHVEVDNGPKLTKYHEWHSVLIGLNHGKDIKPARLGGVMAAECREAWGRTLWREWLIGHWHTKGEAMYVPVSEQQGVRVRTIPSLTPPDAWHARNGYIGNVRAAECLIYHPEAGYRAQFSHVPQSLVGK